MHVEVEQTAELTEEQYHAVKKYLTQNATHTGHFERFMVRFFEKKVDVRIPLDIRYKWTNGKNELVVKKGALGSHSRQEITISLGKENQLHQFTQMFSSMGYTTGLAIFREIDRYQTDTVEAALVIAGSYYFIEVESTAAKTKKAALADIAAFFTQLQLSPLSKPAYQKMLRTHDKHVNLHFSLKDFPEALLTSSYWKAIMKKVQVVK